MGYSPWEPGRWWKVVAPDGSLWCETSSEREAREALRPGDRLFRLWQRTEYEWEETPNNHLTRVK
jgi:hypothetical protein